MKSLSPLRYPGGKLKLAPLLREIVIINGLEGCDYAEPYAGGANVALSLLDEKLVSRAHINDISKPIYAFWWAVLNETDALCRMIADTTISMETWQKEKAIVDGEGDDLLSLGFATFFLNRTNFSGVLKGGVIGGRKQDGPYKMDARFNKRNLIQRIEHVAMMRDNIVLSNMDAHEMLEKVISREKENWFVYLDPPYYAKGRSLYIDYYKHEDHAEIAKSLAAMDDVPWVVSYDDVEAIRDMYDGFQTIEYGLQYNANKAYTGKEVIFCSDALRLPDAQVAI